MSGVGPHASGRAGRRRRGQLAIIRADKISAFRNYFDDATLMEQMLAA